MLKKILNIIMRIAKGWILFPLTALILVLKLSNDMFEAIMNIFVKELRLFSFIFSTIQWYIYIKTKLSFVKTHLNASLFATFTYRIMKYYKERRKDYENVWVEKFPIRRITNCANRRFMVDMDICKRNAREKLISLSLSHEKHTL